MTNEDADRWQRSPVATHEPQVLQETKISPRQFALREGSLHNNVGFEAEIQLVYALWGGLAHRAGLLFCSKCVSDWWEQSRLVFKVQQHT